MTKEERDAKEREMSAWGTRGMVSKEKAEAYEKRIERHLMQEAQEFAFDGEEDERRERGNVKLFGSVNEIAPIYVGGAWTIEAPFTLYSTAAGGKVREKFVILRAFSDLKLDRSIDLNVKMATMVAEKLKKDVVIEITTVTVIMWLRLRGQFFWLEHANDDTIDPKESMYFDNSDRKLRRIMSEDFKTWMHAHSGISPANERMWKQVIEGIKTTSTNPQISRGVKPGNLFDRRGDVIYISCGPSEMVRVDRNGVKIVDNGSDGVVFALGKTLAPWELFDEKEGKNPFRETKVFGNANYASPHGRTILELWFLTLASCIRNYPIILFQGRYRSGKTRCAQAMFELLGIPVSMNSIQDNGQEDFWALLNKGGVVCYDNVDGRIVKWFPNDIQIASTGGSKTKRKMYTDDETVSLGANAKIMLTANDPKFMADSGISDRVLNIELLPFTASNGKDSEDSKLTDEIVAMRSAAFTWMAYTISRALANDAEVPKNLNKRHPDFASFALRCSRALSYFDEVKAALIYAEFNKSYQTVITDRIAQMIYEVIRSKIQSFIDAGMSPSYEFTSNEMLTEIKSKFSEQVDEEDRQLTNRVIGKVLNKHLAEFAACFKCSPPRILAGITRYCFTGFTDTYEVMTKEVTGDDASTANSVEDGDFDYATGF